MPEIASALARPVARPGRGGIPRASSTSRFSLPARAADGAVWLYQKTLSPVLAASFPSWGCRFHPTCSHFAREALREHGLLAGGALALRRLVRCGPWHPGGLDPVPPHRCTRVNNPATPGLVEAPRT